jgi:hypothetical protein
MKKLSIVAAAMVVVAGAGVVWKQAFADATPSLSIAIPKNVEITVGVSQVHIIGKPTSASTITCAPDTGFPQSAVVTDPGGGHASQITSVINFHDHEIKNGSRYQITGGPDACNAEYDLYTGTLK